MTDRLHLLPKYRRVLETLLRKYLPAVEVWAYGSRVNGRSHDGSDLDLVLRGPGLAEIPLGQLAEFEDAIRESNIPFLVEARDWARLPKLFHREIERDYVVLVVREGKPLEEKSSVAASEWRNLPFSDAVQINPPVPLDRGTTYPFVSMASVSAGSRYAYPFEQREFRGGGSRFQNGDTLMARITPCLENGKIARYHAPESVILAHGSTEFIVIRGRSNITGNDFAYYLTQSEWVRNYATGQMMGTSGRQRVPTWSLDHLIVSLPPLSEQYAIAHILGTLDDKIELNRRMNDTLEEMARALFKSWFVDFEPVLAKMEGRWRRGESLPGLPAEYYGLFPDRMADSELGGIPEGWEVKALGECVNLKMGQSPPGSTYNEHGKGLPFFQGRADFGFRYPSNRRFCTAPTRIAQPGDTLVSVRAPVGDINLAWSHCCIGRGVAALRHKSGSMSFTYYSTRAIQAMLREFEHTGTVFGAITKSQFGALRLIEPDPYVLNAFSSFARPTDVRIRSNFAESRTLAALRDAMLPQLISGKIRVFDAGKHKNQIHDVSLSLLPTDEVLA